MMTKRTGKNTKPKELHLSRVRLDELVEEALVDANGESEQATGFYTMLENDLKLPFEKQILGVMATVERVDITDDDQLAAVCRAGKTRHRISLSELPLPWPPPKGPSGSSRIDTGELVPQDEHTRAALFVNSLFARLPLAPD
jgi:hypothetical protein